MSSDKKYLDLKNKIASESSSVPNLYRTTIGTLTDTQSVTDVRNFVFNHFKEELKERPSFHKYICKLPQDFQDMVSKIRESQNILRDICKQFENCDITPLPETDELYVSHYNIDGGGDQGLFDKHYDGVLRLLDDATIVRALVYINSNDNFVVHFLDTGISHNFKTNEYGILDFNREYHWVEGKYDDNMDINDTRILLKINYLVCPKCSDMYAKFVIWLNCIVFYIVKTAMEYSKSPKTPLQSFVGFFCNLFRIVNNINVWLSIILAVVLLAVTGMTGYGIFIVLVGLMKSQKNSGLMKSQTNSGLMKSQTNSGFMKSQTNFGLSSSAKVKYSVLNFGSTWH